MPQPLPRNIRSAVFRANSQYELRPLDELPIHQRNLLGDSLKDADSYGLLLPRAAAHLNIKAVSRDTAMLYLGLLQPGPLPPYLQHELGEQCDAAIAELVLDSVLEIACNDVFVTGSAAYSALYPEGAPQPSSSNRIARISQAALEYAQMLETCDSFQLSFRLYCYNRIPASAYWLQLLPNRDRVTEYLKICTPGTLKTMLDEHWIQTAGAASDDGWNSWKTKYWRAPSVERGLNYKLYISPDLQHTAQVFAASVETFTRLGVPAFKVGRDLYGLLRPDKFVAYFDDFEALQEAAGLLSRNLAGTPAHGVPFTAELAGDGLLSWGTDPPTQRQGPWRNTRESWRFWLTNRLAVALIAAKNTHTGVLQPWQFAMERMRLEGVDTTTWTPAPDIWQEYTFTED